MVRSATKAGLSGAAGESPGTGANGSGSDKAANVENLLVRQEELFGRLDALSRKQADLISADETDNLLRLLTERQVVIDQIAETNIILEPFRVRWDAFLADLPEINRQRVRTRLDAVAQLAGAIAQRDEHDRRKLQSRRDAMAVELTKVASGRGAVAAYGGSRAGDGPRYQDREA
jgi:hypothetical protein